MQFGDTMPSVNSVKDAGMGAIFGAVLGDAVGAYVEFRKRVAISKKDVSDALALVGGGSHRLGPAQYTDDGEMTVSSLIALGKQTSAMEKSGSRVCHYSLQPHTEAYLQWFRSKPFGIGSATYQALRCLDIKERVADPTLAFNAAIHRNKTSQSNGALMRATPLPIFAHHLLLKDPKKFAQLISFDVHFTHNNLLVHACVISYDIAIASLLQPQELGQRKLAVDRVGEWLRTHECPIHVPMRAGSLSLYEFWQKHIESCPRGDEDLSDGSLFGDEMKIDGGAMGWIIFGWTLAFRHLIRGSKWKKAIKETIQLGGDTDTNACIVGGLIGCADGFSSLDSDMIAKLRGMDPSKFDLNADDGQQRPERFAGRHIESYITSVLESAPETLQFDSITLNLIKDFLAPLDVLH